LHDEGISKIGNVMDLAIEQGILQKSGAWITYDSERLGQGKENARLYLKGQPKLLDKLERQIREKIAK
jgi:recombination protein RecA